VGQEYQAPHRTIFCIDDDEAILRYEKALLEKSGYTILAAASAQQGLRLATMCKCDAVLLDYEMPRHERTRGCRRNKTREAGVVI
jgi:DNA-binding response OmpR family regulator